MKTVTILCQKGGVGKTTLALHLATVAIAFGYPAVVVDTDPQSSAATWRDNRTSGNPEVVPLPSSRLERGLAAAARGGVALAIVDTPPNSQSGPLDAARLADLILIPCRPAILDIQALKFTRDIIQLAKRPAFVVLNMVPPNAPKLIADASDAIKTYGLECAPVCLHERAAYRHAMAQFQTVNELEPSSKATEDLLAVFAWVQARLGLDSAPERLTA